jgi:adenylosuccinate synthase
LSTALVGEGRLVARGDAVHVGGHTVEHLGVKTHHRPYPPGALHQCEHRLQIEGVCGARKGGAVLRFAPLPLRWV